MIQNNLLIEKLNAYYSENKVVRRAYDYRRSCKRGTKISGIYGSR